MREAPGMRQSVVAGASPSCEYTLMVRSKSLLHEPPC